MSNRPSLRGRVATFLVHAIVKHWPSDDDAAMVRRARRIFGPPKPSQSKQLSGLRIDAVNNGVCGEWLIPEHLTFPDAVMLYIHGGGFISCSAESHRPITTTLARMIGCRVFSLNYRLAPEHPFPAAVEDGVAAVRRLMEQGVLPQNLVLAGDSAGGGLVMATLLSLREQGMTLPCCAACIAPSIDLTGEYNFTNAKSCAMFFPEDGRAFARIYLNGASPKSPLASPLLADLEGLPPLLIQVADKEFLYDDAVRLYEKGTASGVNCQLHVYPGLPHDWHMSGFIPEAKEALREIAGFVKSRLPVREEAPVASAR